MTVFQVCTAPRALLGMAFGMITPDDKYWTHVMMSHMPVGTSVISIRNAADILCAFPSIPRPPDTGVFQFIVKRRAQEPLPWLVEKNH